MFGAPETNL